MTNREREMSEREQRHWDTFNSVSGRRETAIAYTHLVDRYNDDTTACGLRIENNAGILLRELVDRDEPTCTRCAEVSTRVEIRYESNGIDGSTHGTTERYVSDPHAYSWDAIDGIVQGGSIVGGATVQTEAIRADDSGNPIGRWVYHGEWWSTGEPCNTTISATFVAPISIL